MTPAALLLRWYKHHGRDLPWRRTQDPYGILISEIMLQQTQVARVLLFYENWLKRFPTWQDLARAENKDVLHAWAGLGYNRRALLLRNIARQIVDYGVPQTEDAWKKLKGIGPYTAAALSVFSLRQRTLPIDTNIRRTTGRIFLGKPFPQPTDEKKIHLKQKEILPKRGNYFDVPQALFDLATMICTKIPHCQVCPMKRTCKAAPVFLNKTIPIPKQMVKKAKERKHLNKPYPDRIYRGRMLKLIRERPNGLTTERIGPMIDPAYQAVKDRSWIEAMIERLTKDQFLKRQGNKIVLF